MNHWPSYLTKEKLNQFIQSAIKEDIGSGDHSSLATIQPNKQNRAQLLVKEDCILAGIELAQYMFEHYDPKLELEINKKDGEKAKIGDVAFIVTGSALSILSMERLVLNCMQRMSGIATLTNHMVKNIEHTNAKLLDTRKTTPNFRMLEKWAVLIGGGNNHRFGLYDMIMLKDNHIDYAGGILRAIQKTKEYLQTKQLNLPIEVETRNLQEVQQALDAGVDRIMLDNFSVATIKEALILINGACQTEASGGITLKTIAQIAETGVDFISSGACIHSAQNIDLSLKAF